MVVQESKFQGWPLKENGVKYCRLMIVAPRSCAIQQPRTKALPQDLEEAEMNAFVTLRQKRESE